MNSRTMRLINVAYHRNGCGMADPFHVVAFTHRTGNVVHTMVATVFSAPGRVAVLDAGMAAHGKIAFGENSWSGDDFEPELRQWIAQYEDGRAELSIPADLRQMSTRETG